MTQRTRSRTFTSGVSSPINLRQFDDSTLLSPSYTPTLRKRSPPSSRGSPILTHNNGTSPVLQRLQFKFFGEQRLSAGSQSDEEFEVRPRSSSALGFIKREDNCEFQIPNLTPPCSPMSQKYQKYQRSRSGSSELGDLNVNLYKNILSSDSEDEKLNFSTAKPREPLKAKSSLGSPEISMYEKAHFLDKDDEKIELNSLGTITWSFRYIPKEHRLLIKLIDISLNYQPSPKVKECNWTINPILTIEVAKDLRSPESKRKIASVFQKNHSHILEKEGTCSISLKHKTNEHYFLKMILYEDDIKQKELAIGAVHVDVMDTITSDGSEKIITKELSMYHQLYGTSVGTISGQLQWNSYERLFMLKLSSMNYHKELPHLKEIFIKASIFISQTEYEDFRTECLPAAKQIQIQQDFHITITPDRIRNMWILLQVFEKHLMGSISLHRSIIGPYMKPTLKNNTVSCWEKMILHPGEEVTFLGELYHTSH